MERVAHDDSFSTLKFRMGLDVGPAQHFGGTLVE
jgi:hypothetical protein